MSKNEIPDAMEVKKLPEVPSKIKMVIAERTKILLAKIAAKLPKK